MTQKQRISELIRDEPKSIAQLSNMLPFPRPSIRRVLNTGVRKGFFMRIAKGVYVFTVGDKKVAIVYSGDALKALPLLVKKRFKADMVFLDPPYSTPAVHGGNRPQKFDTITVEQFGTVMQCVAKIMRTSKSALYYIHSCAPSGMKKMLEYNKQIVRAGFYRVAQGRYTKLQSDGVSITLNPLGRKAIAEAVVLYSLSGEVCLHASKTLSFRCKRPAVSGRFGRQTQKPHSMVNTLIRQSTKSNDIVFDPFAGTGVVGEQALSLKRKTFLIEKDHVAVKQHILPRLSNILRSNNV